MKRSFIFLSLLVWSGATFASRAPSNEPCPSQVHRTAFNNLVQFASIIVPEEGMPDPRLTYETFADKFHMTVDEVYDKYLSTGRMYCQENGTWKGSSANIVEKGDVAVLSAHAFYDKNCRPNTASGSEDFSSCLFQTNPRPPQKSTTYHVKSVHTGTKCPYSDKDKNDWAVVKLEAIVDGAHPYRLRSDCVVKTGWTGMNVSAMSKNFGNGRTPSINPSCSARDPDPDPSNGSFHADCASSGLSSGSAMLCDAGRQPPSFGGILIAGQSDPRYDYKEYDRDNNFDTVIPISDEIRSAIRAASK